MNNQIGLVLMSVAAIAGACYGAGDPLGAMPAWQDCPVSILESQIGYHPRNVKRVYLRSAQENPPAGTLTSEFSVIDARTRKAVFSGEVKKWGKKWESFWWVLDFTPLRLQGEYYVQAGKLVSSVFKVEEDVFRKADLGVIALDQLENRIHQGLADTQMPGKYVNCSPEVRIYLDCSSPYAELEPVGTCVYALFDLHEQLGGKFSEKDRQRMIALAAMGADYFVAAQRHTDDPLTDGMFYHSLLVNTNDTWAGEIFTYLDTAYGMSLMAKSYQFFQNTDPARAKRYLEVAKKAWELCSRRPYHTKADRTCPKGCRAIFWNKPDGILDTFGRCLYNIQDKKWTLPMTLRTRDRLPFVKGSALLFEITGERKYLDKAVEFADAIMERQFTDWEKPIEGCFGTFYEFEGDNQTFFHEFMQGGFWWEGNVEAMNLDGFMQLVRLAPAHPRAAAWQNAILTYAGNYARRTTTLNPLGLYPVACYRDEKNGGIKNFQNTLMGSSCLHGFSAKNFLMLGDFLNDASFQGNAIAGVNFIAGLNPGVPNAYKETAWDARSLIKGVGRSWFGPVEEAVTPNGSVPNGFCAAPQFWPNRKRENFISSQPDKPAGILNSKGEDQFNEGWILHSHAYVQAVAWLEAGYTLNLKVMNKGVAVPATVSIRLKDSVAPHTEFSRDCQTGSDGRLTLTDLPVPCGGVVRMSYEGREIIRPIAAIAGGAHACVVDFSRDVNVEIRVPELVPAGGSGEAILLIANTCPEDVTVKMALLSSGVTLEKNELDVPLKRGEKKSFAIPFKCGTKVMPYLVRAVILSGAPERDFNAAGKIRSR